MTNYCIDYSWARPDPRAIAAAGYTGVLRYVSRPDSNGKNITAAEMAALRAAGLDVTLNFEQYETRPREGFTAGVADCSDAERLADFLGYPRTCAIYYSVDTSLAWESIRAYFQGIKTRAWRPVGIYGGTSVGEPALSEGLVVLFWQANAGSWSGATTWDDMLAHHLSPHASLVQHVHNRTPLHIPGLADDQFDPNTVLHTNYGQWLAPGREQQESELGYGSWNDLEKLAFFKDLRNTLAAHDGQGQDPVSGQWGTGLYDVTKSVLKNPSAPPTKLDSILAAVSAVSTHSMSSDDAGDQVLLDAIKALPEATVAAIKAAL